MFVLLFICVVVCFAVLLVGFADVWFLFVLAVFDLFMSLFACCLALVVAGFCLLCCFSLMMFCSWLVCFGGLYFGVYLLFGVWLVYCGLIVL